MANEYAREGEEPFCEMTGPMPVSSIDDAVREAMLLSERLGRRSGLLEAATIVHLGGGFNEIMEVYRNA